MNPRIVLPGTVGRRCAAALLGVAILWTGAGAAAAAQHFAVSGRVVFAGGAGASHIVALIHTQTGRVSMKPCGADGAFTFESVLPGSYALSLVDAITIAGGVATSMRPASTVIPVIVTDRDLTGVEVPAYADMNGRATVDGGAPLPRFSFRLRNTSGFLSQSVVVTPEFSSSSDFSVRLPKTSKFLDVIGLPAGYSVSRFLCGRMDLLEDPLDPAKADSCDLELVFAFRPSTQVARASERP
ncbi:MAG TPA: carboxypeptidase-like regulatory domain-containing protein [Terriglobia bacterium]|nr:carboxypeptidase-like regulatory domain-containing protein [Terriglobia bacterium]